MYGTRDAGAIWEQTYSQVLLSMGFTQGHSSPCTFHHRDLGISLVVHADDFTALSDEEGLDYFEAGMQTFFERKMKGQLSHEHGDPKEIMVF